MGSKVGAAASTKAECDSDSGGFRAIGKLVTLRIALAATIEKAPPGGY
jgi:hypothetical protein